MDLQTVVELAVRWWNSRKRENGTWANHRRVTLVSDQDILDRVTVNFIRHNLTEYDTLVAQFVGKPGQITTARRLRSRVLAAIGLAYPTLADECKRQADDRYSRDENRMRQWRKN